MDDSPEDSQKGQHLMNCPNSFEKHWNKGHHSCEVSCKYRTLVEHTRDKYREQKMICACGSIYTLDHKSRHEKTTKHHQFIQQCNV
jgi:hypothetical protein